jgi:hypothetical protein
LERLPTKDEDIKPAEQTLKATAAQRRAKDCSPRFYFDKSLRALGRRVRFNEKWGVASGARAKGTDWGPKVLLLDTLDEL